MIYIQYYAGESALNTIFGEDAFYISSDAPMAIKTSLTYINTLNQFVESPRNFTLGTWIVSIGFWKSEKDFIKYNRSFSEFFRGKCHPLKVKYLARESYALNQPKLWRSKAG